MPQKNQKQLLNRYLASALAAANALVGILALVVIVTGTLSGILNVFASDADSNLPDSLPGQVRQ